jgi:hypothetical protein
LIWPLLGSAAMFDWLDSWAEGDLPCSRFGTWSSTMVGFRRIRPASMEGRVGRCRQPPGGVDRADNTCYVRPGGRPAKTRRLQATPVRRGSCKLLRSAVHIRTPEQNRE